MHHNKTLISSMTASSSDWANLRTVPQPANHGVAWRSMGGIKPRSLRCDWSSSEADLRGYVPRCTAGFQSPLDRGRSCSRSARFSSTEHPSNRLHHGSERRPELPEAGPVVPSERQQPQHEGDVRRRPGAVRQVQVRPGEVGVMRSGLLVLKARVL